MELCHFLDWQVWKPDAWIGWMQFLGTDVLLAWLGAVRHWKPEVWAAWVQAVGSVVALAIAIRVPLAIHRKQELQRAADAYARSRSYAVRLMKPVGNLFNTVAVIAHELRDDEADDYQGFADRLKVPEEIQVLALELHELGKAGEALQAALVKVDAARNQLEIERIRDQYWEVDPDVRVLPRVDYQNLLTDAKALLDIALIDMRSLFDPASRDHGS